MASIDPGNWGPGNPVYEEFHDTKLRRQEAKEELRRQEAKEGLARAIHREEEMSREAEAAYWADLHDRRLLKAQRINLLKAAQDTKMSPEVLKGLQMSVQLTVDQQLQQKLAERRTEREVERRLALVDSYGEDVYPVGTIISFEKKFDGAPETFTYAVIKGTDTKWFTTGHNHVYGSTLTWDALVEFLVAGNPVTSVIIKPEGGTTLPAPAVTK